MNAAFVSRPATVADPARTTRCLGSALFLAGLYPTASLAIMLLNTDVPMAAFGAVLVGVIVASGVWALTTPRLAQVVAAAAGIHLGTLAALLVTGGPASSLALALGLIAASLVGAQRVQRAGRGEAPEPLPLRPYSHPAL